MKLYNVRSQGWQEYAAIPAGEIEKIIEGEQVKVAFGTRVMTARVTHVEHYPENHWITVDGPGGFQVTQQVAVVAADGTRRIIPRSGDRGILVKLEGEMR